MNDRVWIALLDGAAPQAQAWRDDALAGAMRVQGHAPALYAAFNVPQLACIAQLRGPGAGRAPLPAAPAGAALREHVAELTFEHVQAGVQGGEGEGILYSVRFNVPRDWHDEFDRWYEQEHIPMIYGSPRWSMSRRYRFVGTGEGGPTHLALHYLSDARGLDAPQLKAARNTPWRRKFLGQRWFTDVEKMVYFRQEIA